MAYDEQTAERVRKIFSGRRDVVEKKMMGGLCFMVKGAMCCSVSGRGGLMVRVGPDAHERTLREPHVTAMEMRGRVMTGFVRVTPDGYRTEAGLKKWVQRGLDYIATRPAKPPPGKKRKAASKRSPKK
jgi:TfoX/Sxy family transcriptional regulator of competence genes